MHRLYIDGSAISLLNKGVGRYSYELAQRVIDKLDCEWDIDLIVYTNDIPPSLRNNPRVNLVKTPRMSDLFHNLVWLPYHLNSQCYDVLLKPMESSGFDCHIPTITVCHDVQELIDKAATLHPHLHRVFINFVKRVFKSLNLRKSAVVVCNSIFTQNTAASWYKFDVKKSVVGYCGVDDRFFNRAIEVAICEREKIFNLSSFILTFATGDARENYKLLPGILSNIRRMGCDSKLVIAGVRRGSDYLCKMEQELSKYNFHSGIDYQFIEFLGEERLPDLIELYSTADFYLELSGHEGFGMQLAEAMACGTTCISSGAGALTEVGAGFDIQYSGFDPEAIARTIVGAYQSGLHQRDNRKQVKYVHVHYSWDAVADLVVNQIVRLSQGEGQGTPHS